MVELKREKVIGTGQSFLMFLDLALKSKMLKGGEAKKPHQEIMTILEKMGSKDLAPDVAVTQINEQVASVNEHLEQIRYPSIVTRSELDFLRNEVVAFEIFLNSALNAKLISFESETELFNKAVAVWEDIGHIQQSQSINAHINIVKQANALLPQEHHYPVPAEGDFPALSASADKAAVAPTVQRKKQAAPGE